MLGIVAGICQQIDLIGQIDARVLVPGRKVSIGQAVQAMVINGLGFISRPLYLSPEFFRNKPIDLNEDSLGRCMDYLYEVGVSEVFAAVCAHALQVFEIPVRFSHIDTTAFGLEGQYEYEKGIKMNRKMSRSPFVLSMATPKIVVRT